MGNTYGKKFRITTFGESHGKAIGVTIDGCPAGLEIDEDFIQNELDRRKPGQSKITTQRKEGDRAEILSGVFEGKSTGTPIAILFPLVLYILYSQLTISLYFLCVLASCFCI